MQAGVEGETREGDARGRAWLRRREGLKTRPRAVAVKNLDLR